MSIRLSAAPLTAALVLAAAGPAPAQFGTSSFAQKTQTRFLKSFKEVVARALPGVVRVRAAGKDVALGTVVRADGYLVTKNSLVGGDIVVVLRDDTELPGTVVASDEAFDLALVKVKPAKPLTALTFADAAGERAGNWVASVGMRDLPAAVGVVSVASRTLGKRELEIETKIPQGGFLGISPVQSGKKIVIEFPTGRDGDEGPPLRESAARDAGIREGDVLLSLNGQTVTTRESVFDILGKTRVNQRIKVLVSRDGVEKEYEVTLRRRPILQREEIQNAMGSEISVRRYGFPTILQHDTVLPPSLCGGPLVDLDGKVIGVNIARSGRVETVAVPSEALRPVLAALLSEAGVPDADSKRTTVRPGQ